MGRIVGQMAGVAELLFILQLQQLLAVKTSHDRGALHKCA
jgi:hypothetical protein